MIFHVRQILPKKCAIAGRFLLWASMLALGSIVAAAAGNPNQIDFSRLVVVGDSLSAGFQNFSLNDAGQLNGYASLVAKQAGLAFGSQFGKNTFALPLIGQPGIPPALYFDGQKIQQYTSPGSPVPGGQPSNLSVPGFTVLDALAHPFPGSPTTNPIDALSDIVFTRGGSIPCGPIPTTVLSFLPTISSILGPTPYVVSEVACAAALNPSAILVSIGNNDALQALTFGLPPTDPTVFATEYGALLGALSATGAKVVVSNIPDVRTIPFLVPEPVFEKGLCGFKPDGATTDDFLVLNLTNPAGGTNLCVNYAVRKKALVDAASAAVVAYNRTIATQARAAGAVLVDINSLISSLAVKGYDVTVNSQTKHLTTAMFGGLFSLDGIHPTNTGYAILANAVISAMNAAPSKTQLGTVNVNTIAATDPLAFPVFLP